MSIKTKLITIFLALIVVPVLILGGLSQSRARESVKTLTLARLHSMADYKARMVEGFFAERKGDLQVLQNSPVIQKAMPVLNQYLDDRQNPAFIQAQAEISRQANILKRIFGYNDVVLVNPAGRVLFAAEPSHAQEKVGNPYLDPDGRTLAAAAKGFYLSEVLFNYNAEGNYVVVAGSPVTDEAGKSLGIIIFEINLDPLFNIIGETTGLGRTGEMVLAKKKDGAVHFLSPLRFNPRTDAKPVIPFRSGAALPAQSAVSGQNGEGLARDYRGGEVLAAWRYLPSLDWGLVVKIDAAEAFTPVTALRELFFGIGLTAILMGAVLAYLLGRSITLPLLQLEEGAKIIGRGNLDHKIGNPAPDEVGRLARAFDQMTDRLKTVTASRDELNEEIAGRIRAEAEMARAERAEEEAREIIEEQRTRAIFSDRLRSLGQMAAGMAHELNQPLLGVRGLAEHLLIALDRGWEMTPDNIREKAGLIVDQADRMSHIIEHARMFARGADTSDLMPVQVNDVIESALSLTGAQLKSRGIETIVELAPGLPAVWANPFSLEEVILNLLTNARDAIEDRREGQQSPDSLSIIIRTALEPTDHGPDGVNIFVIDHGVGVAPENIDKVFDPFFTTKEINRGTGLGLSISRTIMTRFGGTIELSSPPGAGTTVTLNLPADDQDRGGSNA